MNVNRENYHFWSVIEEDFGFTIRPHIKNCLNICNCNNVMVLEDFDTDEKIDIVQNYIRTSLPKIVESIELRSGEKLKDFEKSYLFSDRYVSDPENFTFVHGERVVIKNISMHIKSEKAKTQNRFSLATSGKKFAQNNLIQTAVGLIFGEDQQLKISTESDKKHIEEATVIDSKKRLLISIEKINNQYKTARVIELSENNITIDVNDKGNVRASVQCVFCTKFLKVSKKQSSCTWVLSNLKRHIQKSCGATTNAETELDNHLADHDMEAEPNVNKNNGTKSSLLHLEIQPVMQNIDDFDNKSNDDFTSCVERLKTQLKLQRIKMINSVISNGESQKTCEIQVNLRVSQIEVSEMAPDGKCLFHAISHQLAGMKIGSDEHILASRKLRIDNIAHIKKNLPLYERAIKGRVYERFSKNKIHDFPKRCEIFLDETLASDGFWAGSESLEAIADIMETNIIVFNEKGDLYFGNRYDRDYKRSIMIAFRITDPKSNDVSNTNRNHYDSVTKISDQDIFESAEILIKQYLNNRSLQENNDKIIID